MPQAPSPGRPHSWQRCSEHPRLRSCAPGRRYQCPPQRQRDLLPYQIDLVVHVITKARFSGRRRPGSHRQVGRRWIFFSLRLMMRTRPGPVRVGEVGPKPGDTRQPAPAGSSAHGTADIRHLEPAARMQHLLGRQKEQVQSRLHAAPVSTGLCQATFSAAFWQRAWYHARTSRSQRWRPSSISPVPWQRCACCCCDNHTATKVRKLVGLRAATQAGRPGHTARTQGRPRSPS